MGSAAKAFRRQMRDAKKRSEAKTAAEPGRVCMPSHLKLLNPEQHTPSIRIDTIDAADNGKLQVNVLTDNFISMSETVAEEYINLPVFAGERIVEDAQTQYLFDCMRLGTFNWSNTHIAKAVLDGITYKVNGQHTSWAFMYYLDVKSGFTSPPTVRETLYKCTSEEQLRALYATFDRNKARSDGHINKVLLVNKPVNDGIWNNSISRLVSGIKMWRWDYQERQRLMPDHIAACIEHEIAPLYRMVGIFLQEKCKDAKHLQRQGPIAAMFATFEKTAQKAPDFWQPVADGLGLTNKQDPRYKLREWLMQTSTFGSKARTRGQSQNHANAEEMLNVCLTQWNHWRKGDVTQQIRIPAERPKVQ